MMAVTFATLSILWHLGQADEEAGAWDTISWIGILGFVISWGSGLGLPQYGQNWKVGSKCAPQLEQVGIVYSPHLIKNCFLGMRSFHSSPLRVKENRHPDK
jgi:hypothetical protein